MSDNNEKELKYIEPFKYQLLQSFPFIADDFDQLTAYGLFCKLSDKMNEVVENNNNLNDDMILYIQKFNDLKDYIDEYFDDLDVQDEINNKLNKMAQDGTLAEIVGDYVQPLIDNQNDKIDELEDTIDANNQSISNQISVINNRMNSLVSGAPSGVYPTVAALTAADPEYSKIYLVTADKNWYYYNSTLESWSAGGPYFAGDLSTSDNIDVTSLYFGSIGNQLYDYQKTDAKGYYRVDGTFASNTNVTGMYIDLRKLNATDITTNIETYSAFLDESKNVITAYVPMSSGTYSIPSTAVYLYVAKDIPNANRVMVNVGTTGLPLERYQRKLDAIIPSYNDTMIQLDRGFSKEVITPSALTFVHEGNNLINLNSKMKETDTYYSYSSGAKVESGNYNCITIPIKASTNYVASNMIAHVTQWDINDNFITGNLESNVNTPVIFTTNENAKYLRISYSKGAVTDTVIPMLNEGANVLPFEPYNLSIDGITSGSSRFRPYQSGFITFNVSVNQVIPEVNTTENTVADNQSFENVGCMLKLPQSYSASGQPTKLLMICHGAGRPVVRS